MTRDVISLGSSDDEPTEPLDGDEEWLGGAGVAEDGTLREAGDEPAG